MGEKEKDFFGDDEIQLPENVENDSYFRDTDISSAISGETVSSILMGESNVLRTPSYLIELTGLCVCESALTSLNYLMDENGDTAIYIKNGDNLFYIGSGDNRTLYMILAKYISKAFPDGTKLYYYKDGGFKEFSPTDITGIKLDI